LPPLNSNPIIDSEPPLQASVGIAYQYQIEASDPDLDNLSYVLDTAPQTMTLSDQVEAYDADADPLTYQLVLFPTGMTLNEFGEISWLHSI
tara:strand:+ start:14973 stop:15245 length:273 start_codon:yes stop_codon:yes gene_type:complete